MITELADWVKHAIALHRPVQGSGDKKPWIEHLRMVERMTKTKTPEIQKFEARPDLYYLWDICLQFPATSATWREVLAFCGHTGLRLEGWEIRQILSLDQLRT